MPGPRRSNRSETPLEAQKRALLKQQEDLQRQMQQLQANIQRIPGEAREKQKRDEERKARERAERGSRLDPPASKINYRLAAETKSRSLRHEQRDAVVKLVVLVCILLGMLFWIYTLRP